MNAVATSSAATDFLFMFTGLLGATDLAPRVYYPEARQMRERPALAKDGCRFCDATNEASAFARGDLCPLALKPDSRPRPAAPSRRWASVASLAAHVWHRLRGA